VREESREVFMLLHRFIYSGVLTSTTLIAWALANKYTFFDYLTLLLLCILAVTSFIYSEYALVMFIVLRKNVSLIFRCSIIGSINFFANHIIGLAAVEYLSIDPLQGAGLNLLLSVVIWYIFLFF
jgi:hypothetical protein